VKSKLTSPAGKEAVKDLEDKPEEGDNRKAAEAALSKFLRSDANALADRCFHHALGKEVELTRQAVEAVNSINPRIIVEGELGFIGSGSEIHESVPESSRLLTKTDDAKRFVEATQIDVLAPAVGNMHGLLKSMISGSVRKRLDIDRIREIAAATAVPLTLHGGSGTDDGDFQKAISAGITIVHINTELRLAGRRGLEAALAENSDEVVPYKSTANPSRPWRRSPASACAYSMRGEFAPAIESLLVLARAITAPWPKARSIRMLHDFFLPPA
jgi:Fructose-bisphosphate aldolase class-II